MEREAHGRAYGDSFRTLDDPAQPNGRCLPVPDVLARLAREGDPIPTGFAPLDRQCRGGGLRAGRVLVIGGAPEAGKTTLACQIMNHLAPLYPTVALFKDEGMDQAAVRIGIMLGHEQDKLQRGDEAEIAAIREQLGGMVFDLIDPDAPGMCLEAALANLDHVAPQKNGLVRVLGVDSLQTVSVTPRPAKDQRTQMDENMEFLRTQARLRNLIVIATSRVAREFYAAKKSEDRREAAAAFLGSAGIEFGGDVNLVIHPPKDGVSMCELTKNRLRVGHSKTFYVALDLARGMVLEVDQVAGKEEETQQRDRKHEETIARIAKDAEANLRKRGGLTGRQIVQLVGGKSTYVAEALRGLENQGVVECEPGPRGAIVWRVRAGPRASDSQ